MSKTSKIKEVIFIKPYNGQNGTVYYHNVEMENGDKINIGKLKEYGVGDELTYEIIGDLGQHEFTKAKSVKLEQRKSDDYKVGIEVGHAVNNAVNMVCAGVELIDVEYTNTNSKIRAYAEWVLKLSDHLKSQR